ncbi:MAG: transposase, partial [Herminiimonas sp.]|nr:transposase [Herminiimonas sp.]
FDAQLDSVRLSRVIAMDETPIKAGRAGPGKMKAAYFWPVVGEQDEICFLYYPSRAAKHIEDALGLTRPNGAVLQSDGYSAYAHYAKKTGITHAQCWAHSRRKIYDARDIEPAHADQALDAIAALYKGEQQIRNDGLTGQAKRERRQEQSKPVLDRFFAGSTSSSTSRASCRAVPSSVRWRISASAASGYPSIWTTRTCRSTPTTWNVPCGSFRWAKRIGCSAGLNWAPSISASCRACWPPAGCMTSTRMTTSSTYCSASASTRRHWCISSRRASGNRCSPPIRCGPICMTLVHGVRTPDADRFTPNMTSFLPPVVEIVVPRNLCSRDHLTTLHTNFIISDG